MTPMEIAIHELHKRGMITDQGLVKIAQIKKSAMLGIKGGSANWKEYLRLGTALAAANAVVSALIPVAARTGEKLIHGQRVRDTYPKMMDRFPDLKEYPEQDVKERFEVLDKYAPSLTENPLVAGTFIKNQLQYEGIDASALKDITQTQDTIRRDSLRAALELAEKDVLKDTMGGFMSGARKDIIGGDD